MNTLVHHIFNPKKQKSMETKSTTKLIGIGAQKGGVGKSSIATLLAGYLYYTQGYELAVMDCDFPQHSIIGLRERDKEELEKDPAKMERAIQHFQTLGKPAYRIVPVRPNEALQQATELAKQHPELEFILFDLPGSIDVSGVLGLSLELDYIFSPVLPDMQTIESALTYAQILYEQGVLLDNSSLQHIYLFWNQVDGREKTNLINIYTQFFQSEGIGVLKSFLPRSVRFNKETAYNEGAVFRSTFFPPDKSLLKGSHIEALAFEIMNLIHPQ